MLIIKETKCERGFPGGSVLKNSPANAGDAADVGSISGSGRSCVGGDGSPLQIPAWKVPSTEEPGGLHSP